MKKTIVFPALILLVSVMFAAGGLRAQEKKGEEDSPFAHFQKTAASYNLILHDSHNKEYRLNYWYSDGQTQVYIGVIYYGAAFPLQYCYGYYHTDYLEWTLNGLADDYYWSNVSIGYKKKGYASTPLGYSGEVRLYYGPATAGDAANIIDLFRR